MINYRSLNGRLHGGMKYQLIDDMVQISLPSAFHSIHPVKNRVLYQNWEKVAFITPYGSRLRIYAPYRWNGANAAIDSADFMEGSMVHDVLCDMIEKGILPLSLWGPSADVMRRINKQEKMPWLRRQYTWFFVRLHGVRKKVWR